MRLIITFLFCLSAPLILFSQNNIWKKEAKQVLKSYHQVYQFDNSQKNQFLELQQEYLSKEASLSAIKTTDYDRYLVKRQQLKTTTEKSMLRFLNDRQLSVYQKQQEIKAQKETELKAKLKKEGASVEEIKRALLEME